MSSVSGYQQNPICWLSACDSNEYVCQLEDLADSVYINQTIALFEKDSYLTYVVLDSCVWRHDASFYRHNSTMHSPLSTCGQNDGLTDCIIVNVRRSPIFCLTNCPKVTLACHERSGRQRFNIV